MFISVSANAYFKRTIKVSRYKYLTFAISVNIWAVFLLSQCINDSLTWHFCRLMYVSVTDYNPYGLCYCISIDQEQFHVFSSFYIWTIQTLDVALNIKQVKRVQK